MAYQCNFSCAHCFHGELLRSPENFSAVDAQALLDHFIDVYQLEAVTFLGGEPLLYPHIVTMCRFVKERGLAVEICTNAHPGFRTKIQAAAPHLDLFRVSLDGLRDTHDRMRQPGSFDGALAMIDLARDLGIKMGATMTVTRHNLDEVVPLGARLQERGVTEPKLHALRMVGNARLHPDLEVVDTSRYADLHTKINAAGLSLRAIYDSDLSPQPPGTACSNLIAGGWLDRIEADPRGGLTVSCKAVGKNVNAFRWDKQRQMIRYEPRDNDEFTLGIPDVNYQTVTAD